MHVHHQLCQLVEKKVRPITLIDWGGLKKMTKQGQRNDKKFSFK